MKRTILFVSTLFFFLLTLQAQIHEPAKWSSKLVKISDTEAELIFDATIEKGWHLYSTELPSGGPNSMELTIEKITGATVAGKLTPKSKEIKAFDKLFDMNVRYFENKVSMGLKLKTVANKEVSIKGALNFSLCDDTSCLPPTDYDFDLKLAVDKTKPSLAAEEAPIANPASSSESTKILVDSAVTAPTLNQQAAQTSLITDYWTPVIKQLSDFGGEGATKDSTWLYIFIMGFLGGLIALFTPCVWPIIPMTVSFFLKRSKDKRKGIRDAFLYGVSIIVIYVTLGLTITSIYGASELNALSTNGVFNVFFFLMLVVFGASFLGGFEISLPASWSTSIDGKAEKTGGIISLFLMAFTLALVSFSCTGPIIGFLLVEVSTTGSIVAPAIGMFGFSLALALPFTLFALFPSWLKSMPKSGGWMNSVKVVLGFLELAFALKFFSVADLAYQWHILDRETFLALWIVLFALLGFYLLGKIRFPHDDEQHHTTIPGFFLGLASLSFAIYMIPGLWGAPLKSISAFAPPMYTQDFNLYTDEVRAQFDDYDTGMEYAKRQGKPVMIDFTGHGCVNCRKMELSVWTNDQVRSLIKQNYVLITLYVDDKRPLPEPIKVMENGKERKLNTIGDKWSYLQRVKFGSNSQPFYVLLNQAGLPLNKSYAYDENIEAYVNFLEVGLTNYKKGIN